LGKVKGRDGASKEEVRGKEMERSKDRQTNL
jgi:hypothetical protein